MSTIIDLSTLNTAQGFFIQGDTAGDEAGRDVSNAGDVNGDGIADLIVGALRGDDGGIDAGEAYVIYGKAGVTRGMVDLTGLSASDGFIIQGDAEADAAGRSVSGAGDVNGDGIGDLIVGATGGDDGGRYAGEAYVIYGKTGVTRGTVDLTGLAASDGFIIQGDAEADLAGFSVSGAGDINSDGIADVIIGAFGGNDGGTDAGEAYVIYGKVGVTRGTVDLTGLAASDGFIIQGDAAFHRAGFSVSDAGDVNGDGIADVIVGAPNASSGGSTAGEAYVIYGKVGLTRGTVDLSGLAASDGFIIQGDAAGNEAGYSVSSAGDVNGDGIDDLIVGARLAGANAGEAYVIYGKTGATRASVDLTGLAASIGFIIQGDEGGDQAGRSVSGAGDVNGDGLDDLIVGAPLGNNGGGNDAGEAYVIYGKAGATRGAVDLTGLATSDGFIIQGDEARDNAGFSVSGAGDVNGDGIVDVIVGAFAGDNGGGTAGNAYVIYGVRQSPFSTGDDVVFNGVANEAFDGQSGFDQLDMASFTRPITLNTIAGTIASADGGNDTVVNIESFTLGSGDDVVTLGSSGFVVHTGRGNDRVTGGAGVDVLNGGDGDDTLNGGAGSDTLDGVAGTNSLSGGADNDIYIITQGNVTITELLNEGVDEVRTSRGAFTLGANVENLTYTGSGSFVGIGNELGNTVTGGAAYDELYGLAGNDVLSEGGAVADALFGGQGDDIYNVTVRGSSTIEAAGQGIDEVRTTFFIYGLQANIENLTYTDNVQHGAGVGNILDNVITGGSGVDDLFGRAGNDTLRGGSGAANTLLGQEGDDIYVVAASGDSVIEFANQGIDTVQTALSVFTLRDHVENLVYTGSATFTGIGASGDNMITGGAGADFLSGLGGIDILTGGSSADTLLGGIGSDQFRYLGGETGLDRILDFTSGADKIALLGTAFTRTATIDFIQTGGPVASSANSTFLYDVNSGIISYDADGAGAGAAVQIAQLNAGLTLTAGDFIFY